MENLRQNRFLTSGLARLVIIFFIAAGLGWLAFAWRAQSPSREVRQQLRSLASLASSTEKESDDWTVTRLRKIAECFSEDVTGRWELFQGRGLTIRGRNELMRLVVQLHATAKAAHIEFLDILVWQGPIPGEVVAHFTMKVLLPEDPDWIIQEVRLLMKKEEGSWKITRFETVETLKR